MVTFWNITSEKLNDLEISQEEKIIFVSDTGRIFTDFLGKRTEYRDVIYVQSIDNIAPEDSCKNLLYFEISTKKLYFYTNDSYFLLNPDPDSIVYIGRLNVITNVTNLILNKFVEEKKGRQSKINDLIVDYEYNQWLKVDNKNDENDWIIIGKGSNSNIVINDASYDEKGLISIKENCGLIIQDGILSLNLLDERRLPGQIVILNESGKIDEDIYESNGNISWEEI